MLRIMLIRESITGMQVQDRDLTELRLLHYSRGQLQDGSDAAAHQQEAATSPTYAEVDRSKKEKKEEGEGETRLYLC